MSLGRLFFILILIVCSWSCVDNPALKHKSEAIQTCLNLLRAKEGKNLESLEHCQLILVQDADNVDLNNLYYGNNKLNLKKVNPSDIKLYLSEKDDTSKRYITIGYIITDNDHVTVEMTLPNVNWFIEFKSTRTDDTWKFKLSHIYIR